ncbi:MAG TPA: hypothetical protein GX707_11560 [Epulopiscium sp.]|nr:hypothetical protein [Candidatus Epulonipiscium sp.]
MQEVLYRAWDKFEKKIVKVNRIDFDKNEIDVVIEKTDSTESFYSCNFDEIELSQYIGIKDIHQKKVFRGDIVKVKETIYTDCSREEIEEIREYIGEVVWHQFGYSIAEKTEDGTRYHFLGTWNIEGEEDDTKEILGNRWDNPEMAVIE